jgi:hypothetical protein
MQPSPHESEEPTRELAQRLLRMAVPATLAGGIVALYPAIADRVVAQLGPGFRPGLVALYVATLVTLFLLDGFLRDRRLARMRRVAERAERSAEVERERARELSLVLELGSALESADRLETGLLDALERLRREVPFTCGAVYLIEDGFRSPQRRGICPLTALPSEAALAALERAGESGEARFETEGAAAACAAVPLKARGETLGFLLCEGLPSLDAATRSRSLAAADRIASAVAQLKLLAEVEDKERALRTAWQELRLSGQRLARQSAKAETAAFAAEAGEMLARPATDALRELGRLRRSLRANGELPPELARVEEKVETIRQRAEELLARGHRRERPRDVVVNDLVVAAVDLVLPELKRARIEVRLAFDRGLTTVQVAEGPLFHLLVRLLRRLRSELRRAPSPRRLFLETQVLGAGARIRLRANTAGLGASPETKHKALSGSDLKSPKKRRTPLWRPASVTLRREECLGAGVTYDLSIQGTQPAAESPADAAPRRAGAPRSLL